MKLLLHAALLLLIAATPIHVGAQNLGKHFPFLKKMGIHLTPHHVLGAHIECPYFDDNLKEDELPISLENKQREALLRGVLPTYEDEIDGKTVEIVGMDMGIWLAGVKALPGGNTLVMFTYEYGDGGASAIGIYNAKGVRTDYLGMGPNEGTEYYDIDEEHTHISTHHRTVLDFTGERSMALSYKMMRERMFTVADGTINEYGVANYKETGKQVDWTMSERYDYDINDAGHIVLRALPKPQCDGPVDANILLRDPINALYYYAASDAQRLERFNELAGRPEYNVEPEDKDFLNEWHYLLTWDGIHGNNSTPEAVKKAHQGPSGHNNIDSACFTLASLVKFQTSKLDQAYYYGCGPSGNWGYLDGYRQPNKNWHACRIFGDLVKNYSAMYATSAGPATASALALKSKDGKKAALLIVDYRGKEQTLTVDVKGLDGAKNVSAIMLDYTHNATPFSADWRNGTLTLAKPDKNSAAFLVTFDL